MKNRQRKTVLLAAVLAGVMSIGGISAYFTDGDTATNTFTVGKISLDLQEPNWDPEHGKDLTPNVVIKKDPQVRNDGVNPEFVFLEVIVPYANIVTAEKNGEKNAAADTDLYSYTVKEGWTQIGSVKKDTKNKTNTYVYVYGNTVKCTELERDAVTPTLFDSVTFVNLVEDQKLEKSVQQIAINAYGIQTTDLDGGKTAPSDVWTVLSKQIPSTVVETEEDPITDIKK